MKQFLLGMIVCLFATWPFSQGLAQSTAFSHEKIRENCIAGFQIIEQGRFAEAEALVRTSFEAAQQNIGPTASLTRYCRETLGRIYYFGQRFSDAVDLLEPVFDQRLNILGPKDDRTLEAAHNLAVAYNDAGMITESLNLFDDLVAVYRADPSTTAEPSILFHQVGKVHLDAGNYAEARAYLLESIALTHSEEEQHKFSRLRTNGTLSTLLLRENKLEEARSLALRTHESFLIEYGESHPDTLTALSTLIAVGVLIGDPETTIAIETLSTHVRRRSMNEQQLSSSSDQRRVTVSQAELARSIALSYAALHDKGAQGTVELVANTVLRFKAMGGEYDATLRRAAAQLGGDAADAIVNLRSLWSQVEFFESSGQVNRAKNALNQIGFIESSISATSPNFASFLVPPDWKDVSEVLPLSSALLEYMFYRPRSFQTGKAGDLALVGVLMRNGESPEFHHLGVLDDGMKRNIQVLTSLDKKEISTKEIRRASKDLYDRLLQPFEQALSEVEEIFISPDDILHRIPFSLVSGNGQINMEDGWRIRIFPSGRDLLSQDQFQNDGRFVAIGAATYGESVDSLADYETAEAVTAALSVKELTRVRGGAWQDLPGARSEIEALTELLANSSFFIGKVAAPLLGASATEKAMRSVSGPPMVLHLATHGGSTDQGYASNALSRAILGFANANRAGLPDGGPVNNDGIMRGVDVAQLDLHGTRLVTLSACETGDGVVLLGEGVMSLASAFRLAGAENVLMTYWPVDDNATYHFMIDFYSAWLMNLESNPSALPHEALRSTQAAWARDGEHPKHWAAFALIETSIR